MNEKVASFLSLHFNSNGHQTGGHDQLVNPGTLDKSWAGVGTAGRVCMPPQQVYKWEREAAGPPHHRIKETSRPSQVWVRCHVHSATRQVQLSAEAAPKWGWAPVRLGLGRSDQGGLRSLCCTPSLLRMETAVAVGCLLYPKHRWGGQGPPPGCTPWQEPPPGAPGMARGTEGLSGPLGACGIWVTILAACVPLLPYCSCPEPPAQLPYNPICFLSYLLL